MKFKFSLEALLKHRKTLENMAQRSFYEAQSKADESMAKIKSMFEEIDHKRSEISVLEKGGGDISRETQNRDVYIDQLKIKIEREKVVFRELQLEADQKREELTEAVMEYKIVEKLKENKKLEFKKMMNKKEMKLIDELSVIKRGKVI